MARWNRQARLVFVAALGLSTPAWASGSAALEDWPHIRAVTGDIEALIARGIERSPTFRELVTQVDRTGGVVIVMRGRCPASGVVACLLVHTVAKIEGRPYRRILIDDRRSGGSRAEISTIAHEFQHVLEAAEAGDLADTAGLAHHFARIGHSRSSVKTRITTYETEAARRVGQKVFHELN